jgi:serine protease inhibitor
LDFDEGEG